jgi:hypothetical protein
MMPPELAKRLKGSLSLVLKSESEVVVLLMRENLRHVTG